MDPIKEKIEESLMWHYDYGVILQSNLETVNLNYPDLEGKLCLKDSNGLINLYTKQ